MRLDCSMEWSWYGLIAVRDVCGMEWFWNGICFFFRKSWHKQMFVCGSSCGGVNIDEAVLGRNILVIDDVVIGIDILGFDLLVS